jgi:uncharacterized membrane protein YczE
MSVSSFIGSDYLAFRRARQTTCRSRIQVCAAAAIPSSGIFRSIETHPRVRGGYAARATSLVFGLLVFAVGIVLIYDSELGLSPWDVLNQGIAEHTPLSFGTANIAVGLSVLVLGWALGGKIGIGTVANAVLVGAFIDVITRFVDLSGEPLGVRVAMLLAGIGLIGPSSAFYIGADLGAGPRDTLMLVGSRRSGVRVGIVRAAIELCALAAGIVLGGTFGVGTILFALLVGPIVESSFSLLARTPLAIASPDPVPVVIAE